MAIQIVTANRLRDGAVVYLAPDGAWAETLEAAQPFEGKAAIEAALGSAARDVAARLVVNPYPMEVIASGGHLKPARMREIIRAAGPTVRRDLGKQAR